MNQRELEIKRISSEFVRWEMKLINLGSLNLYDAHLFSEHTLCELLNLIFNYKLINLNQLQMNFPAIDLGDKFNSVCFQITATKSRQKIQSTIDKFIAKELNKNYNELFVVVLGKKQKKYTEFNVPDALSFSAENNILDFRDLLKIISSSHIKKLQKISQLLLSENAEPKRTIQKLSNSSKIKRNLRLKKRLQKDFLMELDRKDWERARYEPWIRFKYHNVLIRSVDDKKWPEADAEPESGMSSWFKGEFWDFYENGIELISMGGEAIFNEAEEWDILDWRGDERKDNESYEVVYYNNFLQIPYDYIVEYDMDTDRYHGLPSIFVEYAKDGMPYEDILVGCGGNYEHKHYRYIFDKDMRRKLK